MACYGLLVAIPLLFAAMQTWGAWSGAASRPVRGSAGLASVRVSSGVSLSIEPSSLAPYAESQPPVVFPGYLLPDDGSEEPAHAGS